MQTEQLTAQWTTRQQFLVYVDAQGQIVANDIQGQRVVGVTLEKVNQLKILLTSATEKSEAYHKQLVEAGLIVVPLTAEQQIAKLAEQVERLTQLVAEKSIGGCDGGHCKCSENVSERASGRVDNEPRSGRKTPANPKSDAGA